MAEVLLKNVCKFFGNVRACKDINMSVGDGEFLSILGPSGCGKSTVMRMIAGLETVSSGEIYIGGRLVNDLSPKQRNIAMVFENYALYPHLTVFENIAFPLIMAKKSKQEINDKVSKAMEMLRLHDVTGSFPINISDGQKQRVGIGRAIVRDPDLFLFDEPISHLDIMLRQDLRKEIVRLQRELHTTMIYVTHDQLEALTMGNRIAVMNDSYLQQLGTRSEILDNPSNTFVASFVGDPPINFIPATITDEAGNFSLALDGLAASIPLKESRSLKAVRMAGGARIKLGIRPHHIDISHDTTNREVTGNVDFVEFLDEYNVLTVQVNGVKLLIEAPKSFEASINDKVGMNFPESLLLFFNDQKGDNILAGN
ncbi:MAG: ABC transporter ATP-binding protein [Dethiobacter sp.]|nr:ABC transporter ATP-binding protein [Dethiobacter sp.]